jgi:hypothetical protein
MSFARYAQIASYFVFTSFNCSKGRSGVDFLATQEKVYRCQKNPKRAA